MQSLEQLTNAGIHLVFKSSSGHIVFPKQQRAALGGSRNREIAEFFSRLAALLSSAQTCTVGYACRQALAQTRGLSLSSAARGTILSLFDSLGRYDLEGSVQALDLALSRLREEVKALQNSAAARCRTYLTLGVCTGLAAAVILI